MTRALFIALAALAALSRADLPTPRTDTFAMIGVLP